MFATGDKRMFQALSFRVANRRLRENRERAWAPSSSVRQSQPPEALAGSCRRSATVSSDSNLFLESILLSKGKGLNRGADAAWALTPVAIPCWFSWRARNIARHAFGCTFSTTSPLKRRRNCRSSFLRHSGHCAAYGMSFTREGNS